MDHLPTRILLATDGSECAESAGRVAVDLANRSGAELDVVHAFEFVPPREFAGVALRMRSPSGVREAGAEGSRTSRWGGSRRWGARWPMLGS